MMYHLLVETGGLRQLARIEPDWYTEFYGERTEIFERHLFRSVFEEGDRILIARNGEVAPIELLQLLKDLVAQIQSASDYVLGYSILVDFFEPGEMKGVSRYSRLVHFLRSADREDSIWLTPNSQAGVENFVESTAVRDLHRISVFRSDAKRTSPDFMTALTHPEFEEALRDILQRRISTGYRNRVVLRSPDRARVIARTLNISGFDQTPIMRWHSRSHLSHTGSIAQALLQSLPVEVGLSSDTLSDEENEMLQEYRRRFAVDTERYLSPGWWEGEVRVAAVLFGRALRSTEVPVLMIRNDGEIPPEAETFLERVFPDGCGVTILVARNPGEIVRFEGVSLEMVDDGLSSFGYWEDNTADEFLNASAVLRALPSKVRKILWIHLRTENLVPEPNLEAVYLSCGFSLAEKARIREELQRKGVILPGSGFRLIPELSLSELEETLREEIADLFDVLEGSLIDLYLKGAIHMNQELWDLISHRFPKEKRVETWHGYVHDLAAGGAIDILDNLLNQMDDENAPFLASTLSAHIRVSLRDSRNPDTVQTDASKLHAILNEADIPQNLKADLYLTVGEYELARRAYETALNHAKKGIYTAQETTTAEFNRSGAGHLLMARIMLARRRMTDAGSYLNYAREESEQYDPVTGYMATALEIVRQFLHGNLSRAEKESRTLMHQLRAVGFTEWLILIRFLLGRISFELGDYEEARRRFSRLAQFCVDCALPQPGSVAAAWQIRTSAFLGRPLEELEQSYALLGEKVEALLFLAEAYSREGRFGEALQLLDRADVANAKLERWPRLGVSWDDGFAPIEDALTAVESGDSQISRLIRVYRAWGYAYTDRIEEAVSLFYNLTRETLGLDHDPYGGFYNYLYSTILPEKSQHERDDRLTVLGKAVKFVQERTSRIDTYRDKVQFLSRNEWNRRLMAAAEKHNLV